MLIQRFLCHVFAYLAACEFAGLILAAALVMNLHLEDGFQNWPHSLDYSAAYKSLELVLLGSLYILVGALIVCLIPVLITVSLSYFIPQQYHYWLFTFCGGLIPVGMLVLLGRLPEPFTIPAALLIAGPLSGFVYYRVLCYLRSTLPAPTAG